MQAIPSPAKEPDEIVAPLVFVYLFGVIGVLAAVLSWAFWFRGYA
jgi:hypothetical protein